MKGIPDNTDLDALFGFVPGQGSPFDYVPAWMRIPNIHPTNGNPIAVIRLFHPASGWEWYISEVDRRTHEAFGLVMGDVVEMGYFSLLEIAQIGPIRVERDLYFHPTPLEEIRRAKAHPHRQEDTVQLPEMYIMFRSHPEDEGEDQEEEDRELQETSEVNVQQELHGEESVVIPPLPAYANPFVAVTGLTEQVLQMDAYIRSALRAAMDCTGDDPEAILSRFDQIVSDLGISSEDLWSPEAFLKQVGVSPEVIERWHKAKYQSKYGEAGKPKRRHKAQADGQAEEAQANGQAEEAQANGQAEASPRRRRREAQASGQAEASPRRRRREAQASGPAEASPRRRRRETASAQAEAQSENASKSTKQKARPRYQAGTLVVERGQPIQVMIGWKWQNATVHAVSGRNLIYQVENGRRGKTPVAGLDITWKLA